ncbi:MAG TPA: universal stress protein [Anaerolineales bacterium]|nr:universal stress protein [Anaerolineales bacterium]
MSTEFLIATNGFKGTWSAVEYGVEMAKLLEMKLTLLGVTGNPTPATAGDRRQLDEMLERAVSLCKEKGVKYSLDVQVGEAEKIIPEKANGGDFITVVGPLGRSRFKRWLTGRSIRPLLEKITGPILYVPESRLPLKRILISIGGLGYAESAEKLAIQFAVKNKADVTILHVIPPTDLDYPTAQKVSSHAEDLVETDTPQGRNLKKGLETAHGQGLKANAIVRRGNIVEEILIEAKTGNYDLLCLGSPYSAHTLRHYYTPNVTAEVAESLLCPVLVARYESP